MAAKKEGVSQYKLIRIAIESLRNSIRLHLDSIILFRAGSYPSAFQLSVIAMEEFAKAKWVEDYVWTSTTNNGYPDEQFEQKWLKLLYKHPDKQWAFLAREIFEYSPKFSDFVRDNKLEDKKQNATYVGLSKIKGKVIPSSRVSTPERIKAKDSIQIISLINHEYKYVFEMIDFYDSYFDIFGMNDVMTPELREAVNAWPYKTGLKSNRWSKVWHAKL